MSSSKVVRGSALQAVQPMPWCSAQRTSPPVPPRATSGAPAAVAAEDVERRIEQARESGRMEGDAAAQQRLRGEVQAAVDCLGRAVASLAGHKDRLRREAERDVVRLALEIAKRLLCREISADPDALCGLTRAALDKVGLREVCRVRIHPAHAAAVQNSLQRMGLPERVEVVADPSLEPGGLIFETARGEFDASVTTQFAEIERGFVDLVEGRERA